MKTIKFTTAQPLLAGLFILFLVAQCVALLISYSSGAFYDDELQSLIMKLLTLYSVPFGVIIGGIFGQRGRTPDKSVGNAFWLALILAMVWNLLLFYRTFSFVMADKDSVVSLTGYLNAVSAGGMFLVGGSLTYFFSKKY
jgi:hypothetical protein